LVTLMKNKTITHSKVLSSSEVQLIPKILPPSSWFVIKLWRNKRTKNSILQSIVVVILISSFISIKNKQFSDPYPILMISGLVSAIIAGEARGIMRRYLPPEIILIRGVKG